MSKKHSYDIAFKLSVVEFIATENNREASRKFGVDER
jgi:hypothetical protein